MFEYMGDRLNNALKNIRGLNKITESNIDAAMREIIANFFFDLRQLVNVVDCETLFNDKCHFKLQHNIHSDHQSFQKLVNNRRLDKRFTRHPPIARSDAG